jgi:hypothetical protein
VTGPSRAAGSGCLRFGSPEVEWDAASVNKVVNIRYWLSLQGDIMRLEHMCDLHLEYRSDLFEDDFLLVQPYGGEEGSGYGEGTGTASGKRVNGAVRWSNHPHRRSDGTMLPDAHGVIRTRDGADIMFDLTGRSVLSADGSIRGQNLVATFEAQAEPYAWLNATVCVAEGIIDGQTLKSHIRVHACVNEMLERREKDAPG